MPAHRSISPSYRPPPASTRLARSRLWRKGTQTRCRGLFLPLPLQTGLLNSRATWSMSREESLHAMEPRQEVICMAILKNP